jgi:hypothetical protein
MERADHILKDKLYRYWLFRCWNMDKPIIVWIMLNPSTADHKKDDPTITRCINFSKSWGYGGMIVVNLFAFRATNPKELKKCEDPVGPDNNYYIKNIIQMCDVSVAAWGNDGTYMNRDKEIKTMFPDLLCLKKTVSGNPYHPLYLKSDLKPFKLKEK